MVVGESPFTGRDSGVKGRMPVICGDLAVGEAPDAIAVTTGVYGTLGARKGRKPLLQRTVKHRFSKPQVSSEKKSQSQPPPRNPGEARWFRVLSAIFRNGEDASESARMG